MNYVHPAQILSMISGQLMVLNSIIRCCFFSVKGNLALGIFIGGVPLFKSSSLNFWPVYGPFDI